MGAVGYSIHLIGGRMTVTKFLFLLGLDIGLDRKPISLDCTGAWNKLSKITWQTRQPDGADFFQQTINAK